MLKPSDLRGFLLGALIVAVIAGLIVLRVAGHRPSARPTVAPAGATRRAGAEDCDPQAWRSAAAANRASLVGLVWTPFGRAETGWASYAPLIAHEIGATCPPQSAGFARDYASWQARMKAPADGVLKPAEFDLIRNALALRRPFVQATAKGACPAAPDPATLATAQPDEVFGGKAVRLRPGALSAYRRMIAAARRGGVAAHPPLLALVSGFRDPSEEARRCADGGCNTVTRAHCSAHRTGLAIDLYLEPAPGQDPTATTDDNRRRMTQSAEYRWLVANAATYGFLPYAYEPWHWEWTGEPP